MISEFFGIRKISEGKDKIVYRIKRTYIFFIPFLIFILTFFPMIIIPSLVYLFLASIGLIILEFILWTIITFRISWSKLKGRELNYRAIDYKEQELVINKKDERGFFKYTINYDMSALEGNTKGLSKGEKTFTEVVSKLFGIK